MANGQCAMDVQGQWQDGKILQEEQDINNYGVFAFPSGDTNRMSSFSEMIQFNADNTDEELQACIEFVDYYQSQENVDQYSEYYNQPIPTADPEMPENQPNIPTMIDLGKENGTFTITDQALPTEVADVLFNCQDAVANGQMDPADAGAEIQKAIEDYNSK